MRILIIAFACLLVSCAQEPGLLTQEQMLEITQRATAMGYVCSSFERREDDFVADLRVGAPTLTQAGPEFCQLGRDFPYTSLDDPEFLDTLECSFSGPVDLSEWECIRGVPRRRSEAGSAGIDSRLSESQ